MRLRSPSTTLTLTSTVSPGPKSGISLPAESLAICSCSISSIRFMANSPTAARRDALSCNVFEGRRRLYDRPARLSSIAGAPEPLDIGGPEVGPPLLGHLLGFAPAECRDLGVIARDQQVRDRAALPDLRPSILRVFQESRRETLLAAGRLLTHHTRQEPNAGVDQGQRRDLAAR